MVKFFLENRDTIKIAFSLDAKLLFILLLLHPPLYLLQSWRFKVVIEKCSKKELFFLSWFKIFILGRFLNTIFPQSGNIYRSIRLKKDFNVTYTGYISSYASIIWLDMCMNLVMALALIILLNPGLKIGQFLALKLMTIITVVIIIAPILADLVLKKILFSNRTLYWIHSKLSEVIASSVDNLKDAAFLFKIVYIGMLSFTLTCIVLSLYFLSFGVHVDLPALAVFYTLYKLSTFIVLTPGNLGVQEIMLGFISAEMGIGMAQGVLLSVFIRVVGTCSIFMLGAALGGIDLLRHREEYTKNNEETTDVSLPSR